MLILKLETAQNYAYYGNSFPSTTSSHKLTAIADANGVLTGTT